MPSADIRSSPSTSFGGSTTTCSCSRLRLRLADFLQQSGQRRQIAAVRIWYEFLAEVCSPACPPFQPGPKLIPERLREVSLRLVLAEDHVQRLDDGEAVVEHVPIMLLRLLDAASHGELWQDPVEEVKVVHQAETPRGARSPQNLYKLVPLPLRGDLADEPRMTVDGFSGLRFDRKVEKNGEPHPAQEPERVLQQRLLGDMTHDAITQIR